MQKSYLDYAMSVIIGRAIPDVRDGLKPVHRRILYAAYEAGLTSSSAFRKSATIVGDVLGKYHPHGDSSVYDAMVRLAQEFSMRYPLIDGQGNFGSVDGDPAAAYRYTEARLSRIAMELLADIDKQCVDFTPNFDDSKVEPTVLPSRVPNLLINGSGGIAVGMATNIPPHNLGEIVDATIFLLKNPECPIEDVMRFVPGPDFPTGGLIYGRSGIEAAQRTGRGTIIMRSRITVEPISGKADREQLVVSEFPYQVNKARVHTKIDELRKDKKIEGIVEGRDGVRDESDRDGTRFVIELKKDVLPQVVINQLFRMTDLQATFGVINLAIIGGRPAVLNLKETLQAFIDHRRDVVVRRTRYELNQAEAQRELVTTALDDTERLRAMVEDLLDVVRIEAEAGALHRVPIEPFGLLCEVADAHRTVARDKDVALEVEPAAQQGLVSVDPERLSIALANLVSNAIRHTPRGGSVRLAAKRDDGLLRIQVADTGEGIDAALLPRIFDRAVTAPRSSDGSPHHGLGLTIAREIVLQHGGELLVASEPGQGSVFTLVLPLDV